MRLKLSLASSKMALILSTSDSATLISAMALSTLASPFSRFAFAVSYHASAPFSMAFFSSSLALSSSLSNLIKGLPFLTISPSLQHNHTIFSVIFGLTSTSIVSIKPVVSRDSPLFDGPWDMLYAYTIIPNNMIKTAGIINFLVILWFITRYDGSSAYWWNRLHPTGHRGL